MTRRTVVANNSGFDFAKRKREHWAWQPITADGAAERQKFRLAADPIDRFVLAKLEAEGIESGNAGGATSWLRRVTFDLTGLPPTAEEVERFVADTTSNAFEKVVERLLASPQFGERWGRHWLDLVRYAETRGHEFDPASPTPTNIAIT